MPNKWMMHVKKTMKKMAGQKKSMGKGWFKSVLKSAKSSYRKGGGEHETADVSGPSLGGRRRTRRHRRRHH
jgi:hypothetical protein